MAVARLLADMSETNSRMPATDGGARKPLHIGVFDSGVGGLSVLRALHRRAPGALLDYVADSGHAPYGERDEAFVIERSRVMGRFLLSQGCCTLVVACNTATAAAVGDLRQEFAGVRVVGVEPGIKPAVAASRNQRIGVMATEGTLRSEKFRQLMARHAGEAEWHLQACPGLAAAIEGGDLEAPELVALVEHHCAPLRNADVDTVVLGCTHYPFVAHHIQAALGATVTLIDTADAVARHTLSHDTIAAGRAEPEIARLWTTADPRHLERIAGSWLHFACHVESLPCD
jgi:glutamate racemase